MTSTDAASPTEDPPTPAVILAGGLARRIGGGDKPMREIGGQTILARVIARLAPQCDGLVLNANGDPGAVCCIRPAGDRRYRGQFSGPARRDFGRPRLGGGTAIRYPMDRERTG